MAGLELATLALVGSGEYLPPMESVDRALISRLAAPARIVCLPTAAGSMGAQRLAYWKQLGVEHFTRIGVAVESLLVFDRRSADDPAWAERIAAANFVYLSGGRPDHLYKTLAGSRAWQAIEGVLTQGGVLAGCSAGAMVQGEKFFGFSGWRTGFGLLPGVTIIPHYDELSERLIQVARALLAAGLTVVGIDGNTALVKSGERHEVLGSGHVTIWNRAGRTRYPAGPLPDGLL